MRGARLARTFWGDPAYADRLEYQAAELRHRFNQDFWLPDRGYYALAREPDGSLVDALASNLGHLLWSGIVEPERAGALVEHLLGPGLFTGWGVRTLAEGQAAYNPVGYHVGAARYFDGRLPEAFAGYHRNLTAFPVRYPSATSPQGWSAGAILLLLRTVLGLHPHADHLVVRVTVPPRLGQISLFGRPGSRPAERPPRSRRDRWRPA